MGRTWVAGVLLLAAPESLSPRIVGWDSVETAGLRERVLHIYPKVMHSSQDLGWSAALPPQTYAGS